MTLRLVFARRARRDLQDLLSYIAAEDRTAARTMASRFDKVLRLLTDKPFMGAVAGGLGDPEMRRFSIHLYVVFYRLQTSTLEIVRILHSSMDLSKPGLFDRGS
jgi:plasmid stabilization system protein ParE